MEVVRRVCNKCGVAVKTKRGPAVCPECQTGRSSEYYRRWYERNPERVKQVKRERMRQSRAANPEKYAEHSRKAKRKLKQDLFTRYGGLCALCSFTDVRALTLDHIHNDGAEERMEKSQTQIYREALETFQPMRYRVLCMNCQFITRFETGKHNQQWSRSF